MTKDEFAALYETCLREAKRKYPTEYSWPDEDVPKVVGKMIAAMDNRSAGISHSRGFRLLSKRLGISYTAKAIFAFWGNCT